MGTVTAYEAPLRWWYGRLVILGFLTVVAVVGVVSSINEAARSAGPVLLCGILMWAWHVVLGMPYAVVFDEHDIVFRSIAREMRVSLSDIRAIEAAPTGGWIIQHKSGAIRFSPVFGTELGKILARIQSANPEL